VKNKYYEHTFIFKSNWGETEDFYFNLNANHYCKFCGESYYYLFNNCNKKMDFAYPNDKKQQENYLNEHCNIRCLTEEEYIIKSIIE